MDVVDPTKPDALQPAPALQIASGLPAAKALGVEKKFRSVNSGVATPALQRNEQNEHLQKGVTTPAGLPTLR